MHTVDSSRAPGTHRLFANGRVHTFTEATASTRAGGGGSPLSLIHI